jgi:plasmid stabilization system protein ParE
MRIRWTLAAAADLEHIRDYLQERHPHLAQSTVLKLYEGIRSLKTWISAMTQEHRHLPCNDIWSYISHPDYFTQEGKKA